MLHEPSDVIQQHIDDLVPKPVPKPANNLAVIGNGLDLAVGLDSRYSDFRDYFRTLSTDNLAAGDPTLIKIFDQVQEIAAADWSDFEDALGRISLPGNVANRDYLDDGDLNEMDSLSIEGQVYGDEFRDGLSGVFAEWVKQSVEPQVPTQIPATVTSLVKASDTFLTFNYTSTLQKHCQVRPGQVLHVHGTAQGPSDPYFGCPAVHCAESQGGTNALYSTVRDQTHKDLLSALTKHPRIELVAWFLTHAHPLRTVRSYGFSFGDADIDYVRAIVKCCDTRTTWIHYCYTAIGQAPEDTTSAERCNEVLRLQGFTGSIIFQVS